MREHAQPPVIWQYESPNYEIASSLSSLSLVAPELPTQPQPPVVAPATRSTRRLPDIDEIDTQPPSALRQPRAYPLPVSQRPAAQESTSRALVAIQPNQAIEPQDAASWTAGAASNSAYARMIAGNARGDWRKQLAFNPLDRLRWWLLRPGRIESLLWLSGTILLMLVTGAMLFALAFSFQGTANITNLTAKSATSSNNTGGQARAKATPPPLQVVLTTPGPYAPGEYVDVRGQGFSPHNRVSFKLDGLYTIQDKHGNTALFPTDGRGTFGGTLWLGVGVNWSAGHHTIVARDMATGRLMKQSIVLVVSFNPVVPTTQATPATTVTPGITSTTTPSATTTPNPQGTPVNKTPVPTTPTPSPVPTHTPTVTPTASTTPTVTPTAKPSATATKAPSPTVTPTGSPHASNADLSNALSQSGEPPISTPLSTTTLLIWTMAACYCLSMILLGVAGVLYKRRPRPITGK